MIENLKEKLEHELNVDRNQYYNSISADELAKQIEIKQRIISRLEHMIAILDQVELDKNNAPN